MTNILQGSLRSTCMERKARDQRLSGLYCKGEIPGPRREWTTKLDGHAEHADVWRTVIFS